MNQERAIRMLSTWDKIILRLLHMLLTKITSLCTRMILHCEEQQDGYYFWRWRRIRDKSIRAEILIQDALRYGFINRCDLEHLREEK